MGHLPAGLHRMAQKQRRCSVNPFTRLALAALATIVAATLIAILATAIIFLLEIQ